MIRMLIGYKLSDLFLDISCCKQYSVFNMYVQTEACVANLKI